MLQLRIVAKYCSVAELARAGPARSLRNLTVFVSRPGCLCPDVPKSRAKRWAIFGRSDQVEPFNRRAWVLRFVRVLNPGAAMRVRMTRKADGEVDGIHLKTFQAGLTYDVAPSLGSYLITTGCAEPVGNDDPALLVPLIDAQVVMSAERIRAVVAEMARVRRNSITFAAPEPSEIQ